MTRSRIALQLAATLAAVLILLIASSTLFGLHSLRQANLQVQENHLNSEARLLSDQLTTFHGSLLESTQRLAGLFERRFSQGLRLDAADQVTVGALQTPALMLGSTRLNNDFALVDEFNSLTGGVATVFVRDGDEFTRVTTSLTKQDGQRAIGTRLDHAHPAYAKLLEGQGYVGRAVLFGRYYMTQYTPVRDSAGRVIAVLFVGFDYTDAQRQQFDALKAFRIGQSGSLAILDASNQWLVAPGGGGESPVVTDDIVQGTTQNREGFFWSDGSREYVSVSAPFVDGPWQVIASMPMDEVGEVTQEVGWKLILGNLLAMVLAVGLIAWLLRRRLRPLAALVQQAQALGEGQLSARCHLQNKDEVGELAGSFNRMGDALSTMVERVRGASGQVNGGAERLADLSARALSGIDRQSGEVVSMAGAVEEFSATAQHIADSMRETERLAADNAEQTRSGLDAMDQASRSLQQIASTLAAATELLNTLGQRSQEIGGIVGVITSIAEQTNLLALNAAIEAARAGEQGRGFAVVADEVRSLAARTGEATSEISRMISSIQGETGGAIATMQTSNQLMQAGLERNAEVAAVLSRIAQQTQAAGERFMLITSAAHEQSETATSLSRNLLQVEASNREQRDVLADLDRTAHELESLAGELRREVERFH